MNFLEFLWFIWEGPNLVVFFFSSFTRGKILSVKTYVTIKSNKLHSSSQCYNTFTDLYLQVWKYRAIFNTICSHKICLIPYVNACSHLKTPNTLAEDYKHHEFGNSRGDVKNSPVFTDLLIQACKKFIALATGLFWLQLTVIRKIIF